MEEEFLRGNVMLEGPVIERSEHYYGTENQLMCCQTLQCEMM